MTVAFVDTTVMVDILRQHKPALMWFATQPRLDVTSVAAMELIYSAQNKVAQRESMRLLRRFNTAYLTKDDLIWAYSQLIKFRLMQNVGVSDCLIASISFRLQLPLYTHNLKHMQPLLGKALAVKPY